MAARTPRLRSSAILAACDGAAILLFVTIGLLSHHGGVSAAGYARDALPFLGCWFATAATVGLYPPRRRFALAVTWAAGVPAAVLVRALVLGRTLNGREAAFLAVSLATIGALLVAVRFLVRFTPPAWRRSRPAPSRRR